jgi:hypothetical protein
MKFKRYEVSLTWTFDVREFTDVQPLVKRIIQVTSLSLLNALRHTDRPLLAVKEITDAETKPDSTATHTEWPPSHVAHLDRGDKGSSSDSAAGRG